MTPENIQQQYRETGTLPDGFHFVTEGSAPVDVGLELDEYQKRLNDPKVTARLKRHYEARGQWPPQAFAKPQHGPKTGHTLEERIYALEERVLAYIRARHEPDYLAEEVIEAALDRADTFDEKQVGLLTWVNRIADEAIRGEALDLRAAVLAAAAEDPQAFVV